MTEFKLKLDEDLLKGIADGEVHSIYSDKPKPKRGHSRNEKVVVPVDDDTNMVGYPIVYKGNSNNLPVNLQKIHPSELLSLTADFIDNHVFAKGIVRSEFSNSSNTFKTTLYRLEKKNMISFSTLRSITDYYGYEYRVRFISKKTGEVFDPHEMPVDSNYTEVYKTNDDNPNFVSKSLMLFVNKKLANDYGVKTASAFSKNFEDPDQRKIILKLRTLSDTTIESFRDLDLGYDLDIYLLDNNKE